MARRADILAATAVAAHWTGAATNYIVQTVSGVLYMVYIDSLSDVSFRKSLDGGVSWSLPVLAATAGSTTQLAVWYDRWSAYASDYIHMAFTDSGNDDIFYRTINTASSDALSTQVAVFLGATTAAGGHLSVVRAKGGNVYIKGVIDAGAEGDFFKLALADFPNGAWSNVAVDEAIATLDQMLLLPNLTSADTNDIMAVFQDASVTEISRKLYDQSADTWAEASINNAITELSTATAFRNFDCAVDLVNNLVVLVVWTATDTLNADLLCYTITDATITAKTDVVTNSTDDQGLCAITIDAQTGYWHVWYAGKSDGTETWNTAVNIYTKVSRDSGSTWGPETRVSVLSTGTLRMLYTTNWLYKGPPVVAWYSGAQTEDLRMSVDVTPPRAISVAGVM